MMRLIMAVGWIVAFSANWSAQEEVDRPSITPFSYVRVFGDDEGESHFEDAALALTKLDVGGGVSAEASVMQDLVGVPLQQLVETGVVLGHPSSFHRPLRSRLPRASAWA